MDPLRQILFKLRALWRGRRREVEMAEEMHAHLDRLAEAHRAAGFSPDEARLRARREFGNIPSLEERARDEQRFRWLESLVRDSRFGVRQLRRNPGFATTAILSLTVGIGASSAIFSAVDVILFRPLPFPHADHLSIVRKGPRTGEPVSGVAPANALEIVERVKPFADAVAFTGAQFVVREGSEAERVTGLRVGSAIFRTLGAMPMLGRDFMPSDDQFGTDRVAIISSGLWRRAFAADPQVIGRSLEMGGAQPLTVIGVMPDEFRFPDVYGPAFRPEIWTPLAFAPNEASVKGAGYMFLLLRRRDAWSWDGVQRELDLIARAYEKKEPQAYGREQLRAIPLGQSVIGHLSGTL